MQTSCLVAGAVEGCTQTRAQHTGQGALQRLEVGWCKHLRTLETIEHTQNRKLTLLVGILEGEGGRGAILPRLGAEVVVEARAGGHGLGVEVGGEGAILKQRTSTSEPCTPAACPNRSVPCIHTTISYAALIAAHRVRLGQGRSVTVLPVQNAENSRAAVLRLRPCDRPAHQRGAPTPTLRVLISKSEICDGAREQPAPLQAASATMVRLRSSTTRRPAFHAHTPTNSRAAGRAWWPDTKSQWKGHLKRARKVILIKLFSLIGKKNFPKFFRKKIFVSVWKIRLTKTSRF